MIGEDNVSLAMLLIMDAQKRDLCPSTVAMWCGISSYSHLYDVHLFGNLGKVILELLLSCLWVEM